MARYGLKIVFVFAVIFTAQEAFALKCWQCNNTLQYCGDPFSGDKISAADRTYVECPVRPGGQPVCVKAKLTKTGFTQRTCAYGQQEAKYACRFGVELADFCETCQSDGCNGALQFRPSCSFVVFPILLWIIFSRM